MQTPNTKPSLTVVNALDIYTKDLPPTKWYVGDILHEGACLLSGDPKAGKSFLALEIVIAVAGTSATVCGSLPVHVHGRVLYLALDDRSEKRIHKRLHQLTQDEEALRNIDIVCAGPVPSLAEGLDQLLDELLAATQYELVVLDTLGAVSDTKNSKNVYQAEYQEAIKLQRLAQTHNICLLIIHHTNKRELGDSIAKSSGSNGRTGGVDSVLLLTRTGARGELSTLPRDGEASLLDLDRCENGGWRVRDGQPQMFAPALPTLNQERQEVINALAGGPKTSSELAAELRLKPDTARKRLERMQADGLVTRLESGRYQLPSSADSQSAVCPVHVSEESASGEEVAA